MVTGRYPHENGVMGLTHGDFAWRLHDDEEHLADLLSEAGWRSVLSGIHHADRSDAAFDEVLGESQMGATSDGSRTCLDLAEGAASVIQDQVERPEPLHLHVGFFEPHREPTNPSNFPSPLKPDNYGDTATLPKYILEEGSARDEFRAFEAAIERMDAAVGRILDALDAAGIADETIVMATTDHGIPFPRAKCSPYDPGLETFLIARWPQELPAGVRYEPPISTVDHLPTLFEWLGLEIPDAVTGVSHATAIEAVAGREEVKSPREAIFGELTHHDYTDPRRAIRTGEYKCIVNFTNAPFFMDPSQDHRPDTITVDPERPKLAYHPPVELYNLNEDPMETENLAEEPEHSGARRELLGRLDEWMRNTGDPLLEGIPTPPMYDAALASLESGDTVGPGDLQ
jgi:arylsulfatase A-like enzyme